MAAKRYFIDSDHDGHWYIIPEANRDQWRHWLNIPQHDERSWQVPEFASDLIGGPSNFTFTDPRIL